MTNREKVLLQICIVIGLVGVCFVYVLMPSMKKSGKLAAELESVEAEEIRIMTTVQLTGLEERLESEKVRAEENYEFFYSKLNSYTIDDILNGLAEQNNLDIRSLNISQYSLRDEEEILDKVAEEEGNEEETEEEEQEEKGHYLLGANSSISLIGSYSNVMKFISALNRESDCIVVDSVSITSNHRAATEDTTTNANVSVTIYGIDNSFLKSMEEGGDVE